MIRTKTWQIRHHMILVMAQIFSLAKNANYAIT
jgi:hypothetical protein